MPQSLISFGERASEPMRIISERDDGRGGVVEIPLAVETAGIIASRTHSGGDDTYDITTAMFEQIVSNFGRIPGPTPIYFGHITPAARRTTPAAGVIEKVWLEGDVLWGRLDLGPTAWSSMVIERGFRSFSVELGVDVETPTDTVSGFSLVGGAITNYGALDVSIAAEVTDSADDKHTVVCLTSGLVWPKENMMENKERLELEALQADKVRLEAEKNEAVAKLTLSEQTHKTELEKRDAELATLRANGLKRDVTTALEAGIAAGKIEPAFCEGWEKDPVKWLEESPFSGVDGLKSFIAKAPVVVKMETSNSKIGTGKTDDDNSNNESGKKLSVHEEILALSRKEKITYGDALVRFRSENSDRFGEAVKAYNSSRSDK